MRERESQFSSQNSALDSDLDVNISVSIPEHWSQSRPRTVASGLRSRSTVPDATARSRDPTSRLSMTSRCRSLPGRMHDSAAATSAGAVGGLDGWERPSTASYRRPADISTTRVGAAVCRRRVGLPVRACVCVCVCVMRYQHYTGRWWCAQDRARTDDCSQSS